VELLILLALALDQVGLSAELPDLAHLMQVYVGHMDHRHAPLISSRRRQGLDQMAANIFHTLMETLRESGLLKWQVPPLTRPVMRLPLRNANPSELPAWLETVIGEATLPPLRTCAEVQQVLRR
jgi:hypothetical protein